MYKAGDKVFIIYNDYQRSNGLFCTLQEGVIVSQESLTDWKVKINQREIVLPETMIFADMKAAWAGMEALTVKKTVI